MRLFRPALLLMALASSLCVAACGSTTSSVAAGCKATGGIDPTTLKLLKNGQLTVASDASYPPQEFHDPNTQQIVGFDVDIANELAKRLCLSPNVQDVSFPTIEQPLFKPALGSQRWDLSISAWTINDARKAEGDMIPYFQAGESILVAKGNPKNIQSKNDLCGLNVAVQKTTVEEAEIDNNDGSADGKNGNPTALNIPGGACAKNPVKTLLYTLQTDVVQQLVNGRADATYQDSPVTDYFLSLNPGKVQQGGPLTVSPAPEGIFVRKDNPALENALTQAFNAMRADGTYKAILDKWHVTANAYPPLS